MTTRRLSVSDSDGDRRGKSAPHDDNAGPDADEEMASDARAVAVQAAATRAHIDPVASAAAAAVPPVKYYAVHTKRRRVTAAAAQETAAAAAPTPKHRGRKPKLAKLSDTGDLDECIDLTLSPSDDDAEADSAVAAAAGASHSSSKRARGRPRKSSVSALDASAAASSALAAASARTAAPLSAASSSAAAATASRSASPAVAAAAAAAASPSAATIVTCAHCPRVFTHTNEANLRTHEESCAKRTPEERAKHNAKARQRRANKEAAAKAAAAAAASSKSTPVKRKRASSSGGSGGAGPVLSARLLKAVGYDLDGDDAETVKNKKVYEVEAVRSRRFNRDTLQYEYEIKWLGWPESGTPG